MPDRYLHLRQSCAQLPRMKHRERQDKNQGNEGEFMKRSFKADTFIFRTIFVSLAVILCALPAFAQSVDATVNGTIKDQAGAIVSGTSVTLIDSATGREP